MARPDKDAVAMPPPQALPDTQDSNLSVSSTTSSISRSDPSNRHALASAVHDLTPFSSQSHYPQSSQSSVPSSSQNGTSLHKPGQQPPAHSPRPQPEAHASPTASPSSSTSASPTQGYKRTASGGVKSSNANLTNSPEKSRKAFHSRTMSLETTGTSSVGELSMQLRSRLSHAMSKVQTQMDRQSASQLTSPTSNSSGSQSLLNGPYSPRIAMINANRHSQNLSHAMNGAGDHDAFWAKTMQTRTMPSESHERGRPMPLAPAPDLRVPQPPHIKTDDASARPLQARRAETPTQQEQDVIDTLLFMSSPANNHHRRDATATSASSAQPSPLRTEFARPMRGLPLQNGVPNISRMTSTSSEEDYARRSKVSANEHIARDAGLRAAKRRSLGPGTFKSEKDVDRLLDRMAAEGRGQSSSPELDTQTLSPGEERRLYANEITGVR